MNAQAIALAADSAVTFGGKVKNTANKIFTLSKYEPVGAMVYGSADFKGIPWETILKMFRGAMGSERADVLGDYSDALLRFIHTDARLVDAYKDEARIEGAARRLIEELRRDVVIHREIFELAAEKCTEEDLAIVVQELAKRRLRDEAEENESSDDLEELGLTDELIATLIADVLSGLPITKEAREAIDLAVRRRVASTIDQTTTGLVVAGFGVNDIRPVLRHYRIQDHAHGAIRVQVLESPSLDTNRSIIMPFAQHDVVANFLEGIDPSFRDVMLSMFQTVLHQMPDVIGTFLEDLEPETRQRAVGACKELAEEVSKEMGSKIAAFSRRFFSQPITRVVAALPKDELAAMAESLVRMTSFKRQISLDLETVGGPVDVAVISKGDGFVWIKRKHYFAPELNPQFLQNYLRKVVDDDEGTEKQSHAREDEDHPRRGPHEPLDDATR